jgi:DNA-binding CsgD family transcriptional regulator
VADALTGIAGVAADDGRAEQAVLLFGAAEALREAAGVPIYVYPAYREVYERGIIAARTALGESAFEAKWAAGRMLTLDEAATEAIALAADATGVARQPSAAMSEGLTRRELDVLRLLVAGKTNQEIADILFVSRRTATTHVTNILGKLGVKSRAAAVDYAHRHGLVPSDSPSSA